MSKKKDRICHISPRDSGANPIGIDEIVKGLYNYSKALYLPEITSYCAAKPPPYLNYCRHALQNQY